MRREGKKPPKLQTITCYGSSKKKMCRSGQKSKKRWLVYCLSNRVNDFIGLTSFFWQHLVFVGLKTFRVFGSWELEIKSPQVKRFTRLTTLSVHLDFVLWFVPLAFKTQIKAAGFELQRPTLRCLLRSTLPYYRSEYECVSGSKLWQAWTFIS